jgi:hypothetical protein
LAVQNQGCSYQTQKTLPDNINLTYYLGTSGLLGILLGILTAMIVIELKAHDLPLQVMDFLKSTNISIEEISHAPNKYATHNLLHTFRKPNTKPEENDITFVFLDFYEKSNAVTTIIALNADIL